MNTIIFIVNSFQAPRCLKRVNEFLDNGYNVEVYGFSHETGDIPSSDRFQLNVIGTFKNDVSFLKRFFIIKEALSRLFIKKQGNIVFYYFGLDIAFISRLINRRSYLYEESDLRHTYFNSFLLRYLFERIDKLIIKNSIETVLTSEGFLKFHFGKMIPNNISIIPNRLNKDILNYEELPSLTEFPRKIKIGFVGYIRYQSVYKFVDSFVKYYPEYEFHFFGEIISNESEFNSLRKYKNIFFHGSFATPLDLPQIYSKIDLVLSTYDIAFDNVKYAEPNKIYESIYFKTPIIVSKHTFLAEKVSLLNIGYVVDPFDKNDIIALINDIALKGYDDKVKSCIGLGKDFSINKNDLFFEKIQVKLNK